MTTKVLGVSPTEPGFRRFEVRPHPGSLSWAEGTVPTPHGDVRAAWQRTGRDFRLDASVPSGTVADLAVPAESQRVRVTLDGRVVWDGKSGPALPQDGYATVAGVGPGNHVVRVLPLDEPATEVSALLSPSSTVAEPGDLQAFDVTVTGRAPNRIKGTIEVVTPEGWLASEQVIPVDLASNGRPVSESYRFFVRVPEDAGSGTFAIEARLSAAGRSDVDRSTVRLSRTETISDFESGTQGWQAGTNVASVAAVGSFANGPGRPFAGSGALEATAAPAPANAERVVVFEPEQPLDLAEAQSVLVRVDGYGGAPGASGYQGVVRLTGAGGDVLEKAFAISPDAWNTLEPRHRRLGGSVVGDPDRGVVRRDRQRHGVAAEVPGRRRRVGRLTMPKRAIGLVLLAVFAALLVPVTSGAAPAAEAAAAITRVTVTETGVVVTGTATAQESVEVRALGAETTADPEAPLATASGSASDGTFRVELPRRSDDGTDLLYAQYVAVTGAGSVGQPHFADDVQAPARRAFPYPAEASKKGLQVQLTDDAEELGVQSAAINVSLGELMLTGPDSGRPTIAFPSGGRDFYFDQAVASRLDRQIKPLSDAGAVVDLIILVYRSANPHSAARILMDPAASPTAGTVMGFNTTTREGVAHLTAAMEFLAERYTRDDQRHGRAVGFIMGNEVDAQWEWSNSGEKTLEEFLDAYSRALRIGWLATRSAYADARTYVSLTHSWTRPSGANPDDQRRTRFYAGRDVLDRLQELSDTQGAFPWHVAFHPYPQDLFDPTVWDDPDAVDSPDAPVVTFRNLDVLTTYLSAAGAGPRRPAAPGDPVGAGLQHPGR